MAAASFPGHPIIGIAQYEELQRERKLFPSDKDNQDRLDRAERVLKSIKGKTPSKYRINERNEFELIREEDFKDDVSKIRSSLSQHPSLKVTQVKSMTAPTIWKWKIFPISLGKATERIQIKELACHRFPIRRLNESLRQDVINGLYDHNLEWRRLRIQRNDDASPEDVLISITSLAKRLNAEVSTILQAADRGELANWIEFAVSVDTFQRLN